ncbi:MAG: glycosyltransferase family 39 protein, partial [Anaerolineae bacterium]
MVRQSSHRPRTLLALAGALAVAGLFVISLAYQAIPVYTVKLGADDGAYLYNFWGPEQDAAGNTFRWTKAQSQIVFHNAGQILPTDRPVQLELRTLGVRPPELAGPELKVTLRGNKDQELGAFAVPGELTAQTLTLDPAQAGRGDWVVDLTSETFQPQGDPRALGIVLRRATLSAGNTHLPVLPAFPTTLYAVLIPLLLFLFVHQVRGPSSRLALAVSLGALAIEAVGIALQREETVLYLPLVFGVTLLLGLWTFGQMLVARPLGFSLSLAQTRVQAETLRVSGPTIHRLLWGSGVALLLGGEGLIWLTDWTAVGAGLLVAGMIALWLGMRLGSPLPARTQATAPTRAEYLALGAITLLGLALRLYRLDDVLYGLFRDETRMGLLALRVLQDPSYRPIYEGPPISQSGLLIYLLAATFKVFGASVFTLRAVGSFAGALTIPLVWRLARDWFGDGRVALIAAFGLAVGTMHVYYSRFTLPYVESPLLSIPAYIFLARALRDGRLRNYVLAGLFFGATQYASQVSRISLAVGAFMVLDEMVVQRALPRNFVRGAIAAAIVALVVLAPLAGFVAQHPDDFFARTAEVSLFNDKTSGGDYPINLLKGNVLDYAGMFNVVGDSHGGHVVPTRPEFDPVMGGLFLIGLLVALAHWRTPAHRRLLFWFLAALTPGLLSI